MPGRVSDSCVIAALVELAGYPVEDACQAVIGKYSPEQCDMGVISINKSGHIGNAFNSERMHRAWIDTRGKLTGGVYK